MLKSLLLSTVAFVAVPGIAFAQSQNALSVPAENVVVTATRIATPQDQAASAITVIDAGQIAARQQRTLPDVLQAVPGLNVVQTGGPGGQTSIFMRGTNSNHTKVLLDGIDISDTSTPNGAGDIGKLLTGDIARVEVLRGPQSGLYGSDAIGGVINIITKNGQGAPRFSVTAEGGSFDTSNQQASVSGSQGAFHFNASVDHDHSGATPTTPLALLAPGQKRNDDYYDGVMASTKLGYDVTDNFDLGFVGHYDTSLSYTTGDTFGTNPSPTQTRTDTHQYDTRGTAHLVLWDGRFDQTRGLGFSTSATSSNDPVFGTTLNTGSRTKLDWQGNVKLDAGETLVLGAETARDAIHRPVAAGTTTNAGFAELQSALGALNNSVSIRYDDNSRFGSKVTWREAPEYAIAATGTRVHASIGTGFKAPSLNDLFQNLPAFGFSANPNLKPETSLGYDVGLDQTLFDGVTAGVTWFHNDIKNLITNNASFTTNVNIGKARTQGVESYLAWNVLDTLSLRADYTYTDATDLVAHTELLRRPRNKVSLGADWQALPNLSLNATLVYTGPQIDVNRETFVNGKQPDFTVLNIAANYRFSDALTLFGRVDNLLDQRYQNPNGFQRPGIGAFAGVKASF